MRCKEAESELNSLPSASHSGTVNQRGLSWAVSKAASIPSSTVVTSVVTVVPHLQSLLAAAAGWLVDNCSAFRSLWKTDVGPTVSHSVRVTVMVVCKPGMVSPVLSPNSWHCLHRAIIHGGSLLRNSVSVCREGIDRSHPEAEGVVGQAVAHCLFF